MSLSLRNKAAQQK